MKRREGRLTNGEREGRSKLCWLKRIGLVRRGLARVKKKKGTEKEEQSLVCFYIGKGRVTKVKKKRAKREGRRLRPLACFMIFFCYVVVSFILYFKYLKNN